MIEIDKSLFKFDHSKSNTAEALGCSYTTSEELNANYVNYGTYKAWLIEECSANRMRYIPYVGKILTITAYSSEVSTICSQLLVMFKHTREVDAVFTYLLENNAPKGAGNILKVVFSNHLSVTDVAYNEFLQDLMNPEIMEESLSGLVYFDYSLKTIINTTYKLFNLQKNRAVELLNKIDEVIKAYETNTYTTKSELVEHLLTVCNYYEELYFSLLILSFKLK